MVGRPVAPKKKNGKVDQRHKSSASNAEKARAKIQEILKAGREHLNNSKSKQLKEPEDGSEDEESEDEIIEVEVTESDSEEEEQPKKKKAKSPKAKPIKKKPNIYKKRYQELEAKVNQLSQHQQQPVHQPVYQSPPQARPEPLPLYGSREYLQLQQLQSRQAGYLQGFR